MGLPHVKPKDGSGEEELHSPLTECLARSRSDARAALLETRRVATSHAHWHALLAALLRRMGFRVQESKRIEVDGRHAFLEFLVERDGILVAIELDRRSPRKRSVEKLRHVAAHVRLVGLRELEEVVDLSVGA